MNPSFACLPRPRPSLVAAILCLSTFTAAQADDRQWMPTGVPDVYTQECASCHTGYPPAMLPARSWQRVMSGLDKHYGTDASVDPEPAKAIGSWLQVHAGTYRRVREEPPQDRITRSAWFERKHRKIDTAVWRHGAVKSPANCATCHVGADQGHFDDDDLRFPADLDTRYRRAWND